MYKNAEQIELIFAMDSLAADDAANRLISALHLRDKSVTLYEESMPAQAAIGRIAKDGKLSFKIGAGALSIHFSTMRAFQLQSVTVSMGEPCPLAAWQEVVGALLGCEGFVQACLVNSDYSFWQNAADPLQYQAAGRSMAGLPMISNGLPAPLQKLVVDTSGNPGRRSLKPGYVEMVGHVMWFGPRFWALRGTFRRDNLLACSDFRTSEMRHGVLRMVAAEMPFNDESSGPTQDRLRKLLFE